MANADPVQAAATRVSGNTFDVLGVPPLLGRTFRDDETFTPGLAMLSHHTWQRHFASDQTIVGRSIRLDGRPHEVVGVMGPAFDYPFSDADVWVTFAGMEARQQSIWWRQAHVVRPFARLAPGATFDQAAAELTTIAADLEREYPQTNSGMRAGIGSMQTFLVGDRRATLLLLLAAVGVLQLIACANVANLMLGRAVGRQQELAVRAALGAPRGRLIRQTLAESLVLAGGGTLLGLALGVAGLQAIASLSPPELDALVFRVDWRLAAFAAGLCVASAILAGVWPAWRSARVETTRHLADHSRSGTSGRTRLLAANSFVAFEIGLAVLLVVGAGLLVRSLDQLRRIDPGVDTSNVLTFQVHPSSGTFTSDGARAQFAVDFTQRLERLPGVVTAGAGRGLPLTGYSWTSDFTIDRWAPDQFGTDVRHREATPEYFTALRVPIMQGRLFGEQDLAAGAPVPVVGNQAFADR
jgi:putative ABC transport system permease protein